MQLKARLKEALLQALSRCGIEGASLEVAAATKPEFGDFQYNGAMALAKTLGRSPRDIAVEIAKELEGIAPIKKAEVAGPGFINLTLDESYLEESLNTIAKTESLLDAKSGAKRRVVVDYSGPNMAKQMHVGHLRSTIIGDTIARLAQLLGDEVVRQNHIGDWGTQFGMLIAYMQEQKADAKSSLQDLEAFYKAAKKRFDEDEMFAERSRNNVVKLQSGDSEILELWRRFIEISLHHCELLYEELGVNLKRQDVRAESAYNERLEPVVKRLEDTGVLEISEGAKCAFVQGHEAPLIVQKKDGGYLYATTDLAALEYRYEELKADRIIYVVDARQSQHFEAVFDVAKRAGLVGSNVQLEHVAFGTMMGKDGKPFKTRDGGVVKLADLLSEAKQRAKEAIKERDDLSEEALNRLAAAIGIGAVKYADLSVNRESNYIFDWDKMMSFDGNTALYMQYAYARIQSLLRKNQDSLAEADIVVSSKIEHQLAVKLLSYEDMLCNAYEYSMPNHIANYLYELVTLFMRFYEQMPIFKDEVGKSERQSRLLLASVTARTIKSAMGLLGIEVVDRI